MFIGKRWLVLAIVSSALFLIVVDITVLYAALPRLTHDLAATSSEKLWIVNSYALVVAGLLPGAGTLSDRVGHRRMFMLGLLVFAAASLMAAYAPSPEALIAARVVLAVGAAMMMPATLSIIRLTFTDENERSVAFGIWSAVSSGGAAFGPVIGGFMLNHFWWGSVFLINVPVTIIALILTGLVVPTYAARTERKWDLLGSIQIMICLVTLAYAIKSLSMGGASSLMITIALAACFLCGFLFLRRQRRLSSPLIDIALFKDMRFSAGVVAALMASFAMMGVELVLSQRLQLVLGMTPLEAGLFILPIPVAAFVAGPLTGFFLGRLGAVKLIWNGLLVTAFGLFLVWLKHDGSLLVQSVGLAILGFGIGMAATAAASAIMVYAPRDRAGMAASVEEVSFELGGAFGIAILGSVMSAVYSATLVLPAGMNVSSAVYDSLDQALLTAERLDPVIADRLLGLARSAFDHSFSVVVLTAIVLLVTTAFAIRWMTRREWGVFRPGREVLQ